MAGWGSWTPPRPTDYRLRGAPARGGSQANLRYPVRRPAPRPPGAPGAPAAALPGAADWETPGYVPDYAALISGDYEYLEGLAGLNAANIADEAQLNEVLSGAQRAYEGGVTDYKRQLERGTAQGDVDLGARGTLQSGALAVLRGALNEGYTRGVNQLGEQRAGTERGARMSLAQNVAERARQAAALRASVASRLSQDPRYAPQAGEKARWSPLLNAYQTSSGMLYDQNRQLIGQTAPVDLGYIDEWAKQYPGFTQTKLAAPVTMRPRWVGTGKNRRQVYR